MELCPRLPAEPLKQAILRKKQMLDLSWEELGRRLGVTERTLQRVMSDEWIGVYAADHMALRLGLHASNLWPNEWGAAEPPGQRRNRKARKCKPKQKTA